MKVLIHQIKAPGETVEFRIPGERIRHWLADRADLLRFTPGGARLRLDVVDRLITVSGDFTFGVTFLCGRCGEEFEAELKVPVKMVLAPRPADGLAAEEDENTGYHNGYEINLGKIVLEQVVLAIPGVLLCDPDCPGVA